MASSSYVPSASAAVANVSAASSASSRRHARLSFLFPLKPKKLLLLPTKGSRINRNRSPITKAQLNESKVGGSSNDAVPTESKPEANKKDGDLPSASLSDEAISEFMTQVASLVKLVDSRDIVELQLKQLNCELIIRKREALPQPPAPAPIMMMPPTSQPASVAFAPPPAAAPVPSPAGASPAPPPPPSALKPAKSSHPPLKSPMAGTFYRSPGPGLPMFVKPGDKVNKGQVLCIIEAMKLMNEIEADQSGTVVEILADDGKPVSIDQPLFVIEP